MTVEPNSLAIVSAISMSDETSLPQFAAALSTSASLDEAIVNTCDEVAAKLGSPPDLIMAFVSSNRADECEQIAQEICQRFGSDCFIGCTGESIVGTGREVELQSALSLWAAVLPGASLQTMHLNFERSPEGGAIVGWPDDLEDEWPDGTAMILLGDPFSFPADALLERLNEDRPGVPVIGGMASGAGAPGESRLLIGPAAHQEGAVAVVVHGGVKVRTVVSQGCRPIGTHFVITKAERNVIFELGGKPALIQLKQIFDTLPTREQQLVQNGLHVGRVVSEYQESFQQGDFLIRNVMGIDPDNGSIVVGEFVRPGQTVQFQIRDHQTADDELKQLLAAVRDNSEASPLGALLFTCNGRGTRLFQKDHHDARLVQETLGEIPLAGFFAAGELGPVSGQNFMHGFTASIALFEPP